MRGAIVFAALLSACSAGGSDGGAPDDAGTPADLTALPGADLAARPGSDLAGGGPVDLAMMQSSLYTTSVSLYVEPTAGFTPLTNAIKAAKSTIDVVMYIFTDSTLIQALISAKQSGKTVRVMLEQNPMGGSNTSAYNQLQAGGVQVRYANPAFTLTHEKAMILDGTTLWAMTANFSNAALSSNREYLLVDTDPADAAEATAVFNADWSRLAAAPKKLVVSNQTARAKLHALIPTAQSTLDIEWEELSDTGVGADINNRAKAGVKVRIIAPSTINGTATATLLTSLKVAGVQVRTISSPYMHAKLVVVDSDHGFIGSENATSYSLDQNRELGVLWQNAQVAQQTEATFASDWAAATPY